MAHNVHAYPLQRALLKLSKVLITTSGPCKNGVEPGAQKGRTPNRSIWSKSQEYLELAKRHLERPISTTGSLKPPQSDESARGLSVLAATSATTGAPWQAEAIGRMHALRKRQQALEAQAHVRSFPPFQHLHSSHLSLACDAPGLLLSCGSADFSTVSFWSLEQADLPRSGLLPLWWIAVNVVACWLIALACTAFS